MSKLVVLIPKLVIGEKEKPPEGGSQNLKQCEMITD